MSLTVPTVIAALLPLLATALSSWLNDDHLPQGINALISLVAIIVTAVGCELLAGGLIPGNWPASFVGVLAYVGILMQGDLATLYTFLVAKPSPVAPAPPPKPANANPIRIPAPPPTTPGA